MRDYAALVQFAATDRQRSVVQFLADGHTQEEAGQKFGIGRNSVKGHVERARAHAARKGYSPNHDMTHTVPDGFQVKGVSTYYNKDGKPTGQWVKSQADADRQAEIMRQVVEAMQQDITPRNPVEMAGKCNSELLSLYTLTDYHLGMFAHADECGEDWDTEKAVKTFQRTFSEMVSASPNSEIGLLNIQGDFMHSDGLESVTPAHKNILDQDSRYHVVIDEAVQLIRAAMQLMLTKHQKVTLLIAQGNHDLAGSLWLQLLFKTLYETDERITVIASPNPYYCVTHGKTMLAFHHGHKADMAKFAQIIPAQFPKQWGETEYRYGHIGHRHHAAVKENFGIIIEQHQTLAPKDAHAAHGGYIAERSAKLIVYSRNTGECMSVKVRPQ